MEPFEFGDHVGAAGFCGVGQHRAVAGGVALEISEGGTRAAVSGDLVVVIGIHARAGEAFPQREMLGNGAIKVELFTGLVVGGVILLIPVIADEE